MCRIFVPTKNNNKQLKQNKMNYSNFISETLNSVETKLTKVEMKFAYVIYTTFDVSVEEAINISLEN